jgi:hypothetical protein
MATARGLRPARAACQAPDQPPASWATPCARALLVPRAPPTSPLHATPRYPAPISSLGSRLTPYTQLHQTGVCRWSRLAPRVRPLAR